jgi:2-haloacid dehalogenase
MRTVVTFDCYQTLIAFELDSVTQAILGDRLAEMGVDEREFLRDAATMRFQGVVEEFCPYRDILRRTLRHAMLLYGLEYQDEDGAALVDAIPAFQPFPEVPEALRRLKERYDIAIISNSEDELIEHSVHNIGVEFDYVITAEQARAYKPLPQIFDYALAVLNRDPSQVIHVAQGWEYDIMPTHRYHGMRRIWVNRYGEPGSSAFMPYEEIRDLSELPPLLGL